ncbi:MAG: hypothetical protein ACYSUX_00010 [Planctomycetota bacterium]|jgi:uncharacterized protein (DUF1919 family)
MSTDKEISMLDELQSLLEQQLEQVYQGNSAGKQIEVLGRQADCIVKEITQAGFLERAEFEGQKKKLKKSYEDLCLAITAQKADTAEKLIHIRRGRNIVGTYRSNV